MVDLTEPALKHSSLPFRFRLDWHYRCAMARLDNAKLRDGAQSPLHLFGPYARLPGIADLIGRAFHRPVCVAEGADTAMVRGGQKILADLTWIMRSGRV